MTKAKSYNSQFSNENTDGGNAYLRSVSSQKNKSTLTGKPSNMADSTLKSKTSLAKQGMSRVKDWNATTEFIRKTSPTSLATPMISQKTDFLKHRITDKI